MFCSVYIFVCSVSLIFRFSGEWEELFLVVIGMGLSGVEDELGV